MISLTEEGLIMQTATILGIVFVVPLLAMSILLLSGRGGFLIAGYNTSSEAQKAKYDEKKLCRVTGIMLLVITVATALLFLFIALNTFILVYTGIYTVLVLVSVAVTTYYTNTKCYKINYNSDVVVGLKEIAQSPDYQKEKRRHMAVVIGVCAGALVFTLVILFFVFHSARPTVYAIQDGKFKISTAFGETVPLSTIQSVELKNNLPGDLVRTNGLGLGSVLKGYFEAGGKKLNVYVDTSKPPFLYINTTNGLIIVNGKTAAETKGLYDRLKVGS